MNSLEERCAALWRRLAPGDESVSAGAVDIAFCAAQVVAGYDGEGRFYHTETHLEDVLAKLDWARTALDNDVAALDADGKQRLFDVVELALWYHDAVYDPRRKDNEERSCDLFLDHARRLGLDETLQAEVGALILLTAHHGNAKTLPERLLADCDLAILGADPAAFAAYDANIRREYAHVPPDIYAAARRDVLKRFHDEKPLFRTEAFQREYEASAHRNLAAAITPEPGNRPRAPAGKPH